MAKNLVNKSAAKAPAKGKSPKKEKAPRKPKQSTSAELVEVLAGHQVTALVEKAMVKDMTACMKLVPGIAFDDVKHTLHAKVQAGLISPDQLPS